MTVDELQQFLLDGFPLDPPSFVVEEIRHQTIRVRLPVWHPTADRVARSPDPP